MSVLSDRKRVCLGAFAGAHGVKGDALIKAFTELSHDIAAYGPVETQDGKRSFTFQVVREHKPGIVIVRAPEIASREDAAALKGIRFYVDRDALPAPDVDEFYLDDLVGLTAVDETGAAAGRVVAVHNFGAGDLIELNDIPGVAGARVIAFTKEAAPSVDIPGGRITVMRAAIEAMDPAADPQEDERGEAEEAD